MKVLEAAMKATQMPQLCGQGRTTMKVEFPMVSGFEGNAIKLSIEMELTGCSSNAHQGESSGASRDANENSLTGKEAYVNPAEIAWNQMRKEWVGDRSKKIQRPPEASTICLTEDMLFYGEPFHQPIPLPAVVDYFVKIWEDEGLFEIANR
ncbi:uncharacterized protein LOC123893162 [Trifolium pratense]|uniref:Uncharacterized protein n=2 Tax=Trifolium pratense TaxID=57577 RepID=A0ACB0IK76_TRIPR|nr:uncharacterized protein LOC123893162 [Trifolium pratense]XP_045799040.1 uncharacterized protein LOC123893162 [Trifolium pratense]XP_045799041.1 uncharacterized protein LOC123893162 [Trifolium pratense]CAJ2632542.1 unnamed protein product [Trifolium pratense]